MLTSQDLEDLKKRGITAEDLAHSLPGSQPDFHTYDYRRLLP